VKYYSFQFTIALTLHIICLTILQKLDLAIGFKLTILSFSYLTAGMILALIKRELRSFKFFKRNFLLTFFWSLGICTILYVFFIHPKILRISHVIIAQSIAPTFAIFLSGDYKLRSKKFHESIFHLLPVFTLIILGILEFNSITTYSIFILLLLIFLYTLVQSSMRKVLLLDDIFSSASRICILNFIILMCFNFFNFSLNQILDFSIIPFILPFAIVVLIIHLWSFIGIKNLGPIWSALLFSLAIPISILTETILNSASYDIKKISLGLLYTFLIILNKNKKNLY